VRLPLAVLATLFAASVLAPVAGGATGNASAPDFGLAVRPVAAGPHEPGRPYALRVHNPRKWTATSVRACAAVPPKQAKVVGVGSGGAIRFEGRSACWIVRRIKPGKTARLLFDLRLRRNGKSKSHLKIAATASGGNSNPAAQDLKIALSKHRRQERTRHQHKAHHPAAHSGQPASASITTAACTAPQTPGVAFVIDDSGSMEISDPSHLRAQAIAVGLDQLPDGAIASATTFADYTSTLFKATQLSASTRPGLKQTAAAGLFDEGDTEYAEAFAGARSQLAEMATADRKAVVFLSDGVPTDLGFNPAVPVDVGGAPIYTIGLGVDGTPEAGTVMAQIAANSGGQYYDAQSAGQLQSIFARIVASLTCNSESVTEAFTLDPGASRSIPFAVGPGDSEFRSLASWDLGNVTVSAQRPDATSLTPGTVNPGESFVNETNYALLTGVNPQIGTWNLIVTANQGNASAVHVSIDVFKKLLPIPPPPPPSPGRHIDPCMSYPPGHRTTKKFFGGHEEIYDRAESLFQVCAGFGAPEDLVFTPEMKCALIAAGATFAGNPIAGETNTACNTVDIVNGMANGDWLGPAAGVACGFFSDVFAEGAGIVAAGATAETGPGAVAVGLYTYRALSAFLKVGCGGLLDGGATAVGTKLEADHETHVSLDVTRKGKCMAYRERFHLVAWRAVDCP
jgi:hypothetical protein